MCQKVNRSGPERVMKSPQAFLVLLFCIHSIKCYVKPCAEIMQMQKRDTNDADMKRCGGGGWRPTPPPSSCNQGCISDSSCSGSCPYCKRITATDWRCRADTCSMACLNSSECKGKCSSCKFFKCVDPVQGTCNQGCISDSSCSGSCPYCKRITATNWQCRADTCSMFCLNSSECKGKCGSCFAAKCIECVGDSNCPASKPYCKRITATNRECRADTCSMFCTKSSECKGKCGKCRWLKCKSNGCFPGQSEVMLNGGESRRMDEVRIGDLLLTIENGRLDTTEVLGFLDKRINETINYLNLVLEDGGSLFISRSHVIFIKGVDNEQRDILAKDAQVGDVVFVQDGPKTALARILDIRREEQLGAYVPLTTSGTLLVDGVLVSCYTNAGHWLAHAAMAPLRWWPHLLLDNQLSQDTEGLRTFPGLLREMGRVLGLLEQDGGMGWRQHAGELEEAGIKTTGLAPVMLANCEL